jgi:hypothetical protein
MNPLRPKFMAETLSGSQTANPRVLYTVLRYVHRYVNYFLWLWDFILCMGLGRVRMSIKNSAKT